MSDPHAYDPRFALTAVDDPPLTETGVMLMGLDAERLLAGLGMAALADDPAQVALTVDRAKHGVELRLTFDALVEAGVVRWREARTALDALGGAGAPPASLRKTWERTLAMLDDCDLGAVGPATAAHLAACWLRHQEVDQRAAERGAPQGE
ncbi:DUF6187 family protein [Streptomyces boluensis]|uniref:Uncharacterized protein n=1 Tax=Streptomyces boluensis TaxID=1775135 RepID=A0A964UY98_9ACTN|nr:DUF6187 family protein [Streptomyces boluensis]NBE53775.1 hypothetical protein [Streptomyces boluensis]